MKSTYDPTKTTLLILPVLNLNRSELKLLGFINAYLFANDSKDNNSLYLLFKPTDIDLFEQFRKSNYEIIFKTIYYQDGYIVIVCPIPEQFENDLKVFLDGKYSDFSDNLRDKFDINTDKIALGIINRNIDLKQLLESELDVRLEGDSQVASMPNIQRETLDITVFQTN